MSPRPRKVSDDEVMAAAYRVMQRVRPGDLTLAAIGAEAGITAGALVQRFGSREGLLRALNARFADGSDTMLEGLRAAHPSPLAAIRAYAECVATMVSTPASLAHHLAWLEMDLSDPATHAGVSKHEQATRSLLEQWVREAVTANELRPETDAPSLARVVHTTVTGSMMTYPFFHAAEAESWLRADVDLVLRPYLVGGLLPPQIKGADRAIKGSDQAVLRSRGQSP